jgi:formylglycine-generating enzyme required for sulfatase activity
MGSPGDEPGHRAKEESQHEVTVAKPFYLGVYEVTQAQFKKVMGKNSSKFVKDGGLDHPVEQVSWDDAMAFCKKFSEAPEESKAGRVYRLPTEVEWEYACRAGTTTAYSIGSSLSADQANFDGDALGPRHRGGPAKVGSYSANVLGLFDLHGNVWEWCSEGSFRGGGWRNPADWCRSARRFLGWTKDYKDDNGGFRVVCDVRPPPVVNSIGMKLAHIPAGTFTMGSPPDEPHRLEDEHQHDVVISRPFLMGVHELTVGQFRAFVEATGYKTEAEKNGKGATRFPGGGFDPTCTWKTPGWTQTDEHPVACLARTDVEAFCQWLSKKEGKRYRLPTEAEWEYACRAGTTTAYHFGPGFSDKDANGDDANKSAVKVGAYPANALGLHDMHGNVWEWCADWYLGDYYRQSPRFDPIGPSRPNAPANGVLRGGGWTHGAVQDRAAHRGNLPPDWPRNDFGARIVCEQR